MPKKIISVTEYDHYSDMIPDAFNGYRIAVMSDLHCNEVGTDNSNLIECVYNIDPDAIVMVGDMVNSHCRGMGISHRLITSLALDYPVFYSCGNHELYLETDPKTKYTYRSYRKSLRKHGVYYLDNKSAYIEKDYSLIKLYGLNIGYGYYGKFNRHKLGTDVIDKLIGSKEEDIFTVLLAHNPEHFESYAGWGADIVLSGHIHGGLVVLPYIGGVVSPSLKIFPHYDFGKFVAEYEFCDKIKSEYNPGSTMYLTRGLGWHTFPVRVFNEPEVMIITLNNKR